MDKLIRLVTTSLDVAYNKFALQLLLSFSVPILILSLAIHSNLLFLRFIVGLLVIAGLELIIFRLKQIKVIEFSSLVYAGTAFLFLPIDASFSLTLATMLLTLIFKYAQGGFGKNIFHSSILAILTIYCLYPTSLTLLEVDEIALIYLALIASVLIVLVLYLYKFLASFFIISFAITSLLLVWLTKQNLDYNFIGLIFNNGGLIFIGAIILVSDPILKFTNNLISILLAIAFAITLHFSNQVFELNIAVIFSLLALNFIRYYIFDKAKSKGYLI